MSLRFVASCVLTLKLKFLSIQGRPGPPGLQGSKGEKGSQVNNEHGPVEIYKAGLSDLDMNFICEWQIYA